MKIDAYGNISMFRGDSESLTISMQTDADPPVPILFEAGDQATLTIKTKIDGTLILRKVCTVFEEGKAQFEFLPTDTEPLAARSYAYDVEYKSALGRVKTIVPPLKFTLDGDISEPEDSNG